VKILHVEGSQVLLVCHCCIKGVCQPKRKLLCIQGQCKKEVVLLSVVEDWEEQEELPFLSREPICLYPYKPVGFHLVGKSLDAQLFLHWTRGGNQGVLMVRYSWDLYTKEVDLPFAFVFVSECSFLFGFAGKN